jgi:hypothetical protein
VWSMTDYTTTEKTLEETARGNTVTGEGSSKPSPALPDLPHFESHRVFDFERTQHTHAGAAAHERACVGAAEQRKSDASQKEKRVGSGYVLVRLENGSSFSAPSGLVKYCSNLHTRRKSLTNLKLNLEDAKDVRKEFRAMLSDCQGKKLCLINTVTKERIIMNTHSRWNGDYDYRRAVKQKLLDEVRGLRAGVMLTLTFKPLYVSAIMPFWWTLSIQAYLILVGPTLLTQFLRRLERWMNRNRRKWNYIASVVEFHESGIMHYHILFFGKYIAPIDVIHKFWALCERQGVDVKFLKNLNAINYVTKYIGKITKQCGDKAWEDVYMWAWYFKMRFYNTRHAKKGRKNKCPDNSSTETAQEETWVCVGYATADNEVVYFKRYLDSESNVDIDAELERARKWASLKDFP